MSKQHYYNATVTWTGNLGHGTSGYKDYERSHSISIENKALIPASSDPAFMGDPSKHNPEELFLASLSSCHMLWYLHLCADSGIIVTAYTDYATATMEENEQGGKFIEVVLHPQVLVAGNSMIEKANALHEQANKKCFIANSCNFPVRHAGEVRSQ